MLRLTDFMYQEAFLTTYRTFVPPDQLIDKLLYRYNRFAQKPDLTRKRLSRNAFSLLVRVVDELTYVSLPVCQRFLSALSSSLRDYIL